MVGGRETLFTSTAAHTRSLTAAFERTRGRRYWADKAAVYLLSFCALLVLVPLFSILSDLLHQGFSSLNWDFFTKLPKPVGESGGGMANAIAGTLILLGLALCVGVPVGLGTGIYLSEYAHSRFAYVIRFITDVMNGIPSIVYGIFAYTIFVLPMKSFSGYSGGFALGIMMIPIITRTTEQFLRMVPPSLREAGMALGVPHWRVVTDIVLQTAKGGIITGIMVALARVAGETAPLLFTAFGNRFWHSGLESPSRHCPSRSLLTPSLRSTMAQAPPRPGWRAGPDLHRFYRESHGRLFGTPSQNTVAKKIGVII